MANASLSSAPTTTTTPSSAWSRLVQITRTASEGNRTKSTGTLKQRNQASASDTSTSSCLPLAKKCRRAESPPSRSPTRCVAPPSPEHNDTAGMSARKSSGQSFCSSTSSHDCITACPCRVEDVDCVASQHHKNMTWPRSPPPLATVGACEQHTSLQSQRTESLPSPTQRVPSPALQPDGLETTRNATLIHPGEQTVTEDQVNKTEAAKELPSSALCKFATLVDEDLVGNIVSETGQPSTATSLLATAAGLQEGDQNTVNKTPISKRHSPSPAGTDESIQLATPSTSPTTQPDTRANDTQDDATKPHKSAPAHKTKRRLTLHGGSYERQTSHKKRKTQAKRKDGIQTTLSLAIGSSAGMRECKLCDTVYNPFHPEDVKVHTKRHATALKRERRSEEISGMTTASVVD